MIARPKSSHTVCAAGALVASMVLAAGVVAAQGTDGALVGVVSNINGVRIARAEVIVQGTELRTFTGDSGTYEFHTLAPGRYRVVVRRIGFEPSEQRVTVNGGRRSQLDFELEGVPELLDSVMIREAGGNGRMADFWARRMLGIGAFITRDDIERRNPGRSSDLLRTVSGVRVVLGESGFEHPVITMGRNSVNYNRNTRGGTTLGGDCRVSYYVDGSYVPSGSFHMDDLSPLVIEAVEVYRGPAETPTKLRQRDTACGLIVIWTREPPRPQRPSAA